MKYPKVFDFVKSHFWAITPEYMSTIIAVINGHGNKELAFQIAEDRKAQDRSIQRTNGLAVIPIRGVLMPYATMFSAISGGAIVESIHAQVQAALNDPSVNEILLLIDSPGGEVTGISNLSNTIFEGRSKKKITAYVAGMGASGAYWIASAAHEIVMAETAVVGSIGAMAVYEDHSRADQEAGIDTLIIRSSQSPNKNLDPMTDEGKKSLQEKIDAIAQVFIQDVARNRGVSVETVITNFGKGDVMIAKDGIIKGLSDRVANITSMFKGNGENKELQTQVEALQTEIKALQDASALEIAQAKAAQEKLEQELAEAEALKVTEKLNAVSENLLKEALITPAEKDSVAEFVSIVAGNKQGSDETLEKFKSFLTARGKQYNTEAETKEAPALPQVELPNGTRNVDPQQLLDASAIKALADEKKLPYLEAAKMYYETLTSEGK